MADDDSAKALAVKVHGLATVGRHWFPLITDKMAQAVLDLHAVDEQLRLISHQLCDLPAVRDLVLIRDDLHGFVLRSMESMAATGDALVLTLALVGSLAYLAIHFLVLLPRRMDQLYQQQKLLHEPAAVEINEHAFIAKTRYTEAMLPWTLFRKWKASPEMILLYQSDAMYHILARRWFESQGDFDRLQVILGRHLGPPQG